MSNDKRPTHLINVGKVIVPHYSILGTVGNKRWIAKKAIGSYMLHNIRDFYYI